MTNDNPLLENYDFPPFDRIRVDHFKPAMQHVIDEARHVLERLQNDDTPVEFATLAVPLEGLFARPYDIGQILSALTNGASTPENRKAEEELGLMAGAFVNEVFQNPVLAQRFTALKTVLGDGQSLDAQDLHLYQSLDRRFELSGAYLDDAQKADIRAIDMQLITLASQFSQNLLGAEKANAVLVTDQAELEGLDSSTIASFARAAADNGQNGKWLIIAERLQIDELLKTAPNRTLREKLYKAMLTLCTIPPFDNRDVVRDMLSLRQRRAEILGYPHYASYALRGTMAASLENLQANIATLLPPVLAKYENDIEALQKFAAENDGPAGLEPWDADYWATLYRKKTFQHDAAAFSRYLELENVLQGYLTHAQKLFGIDFKPDTACPAWHEDVRCYEVFDADSREKIATLMIDPYARPDTKYSGAWMENVQLKTATRLPVISMTMNFNRPQPGQKTLLSIEDAVTVFHEGGHALHGMLGTSGRYRSMHSTATSSDFTEIHSTLQEGWVFLPECLETFAKHHETGAPLPQSLYDRMIWSKSFFATTSILKILQNACFDLAAHMGDPNRYADLQALQDSATFHTTHAAHCRPYPLARFMHLFSEAAPKYAAGYYGYYWSDMQAAEAGAPFRQSGHAYDAAWGKKLRDFYALGASIDTNAAFEQFLGRAATPKGFLEDLDIPFTKATQNSAPGLALK